MEVALYPWSAINWVAASSRCFDERSLRTLRRSILSSLLATSDVQHVRYALAMKVGVTPEQLPVLLAAEVKLNRVFLGEPDRAVDLLTMSDHTPARLTTPGLGHRNLQIRGPVSIAYRCRGAVGDEPHPVQVGHHVCRLVLNRLKRADRTSKRYPLLRVFYCYLKILLDQTDQVRAFENRRPIRERFERGNFNDFASGDVDIVENNFSELLSSHGLERGHPDALCLPCHRRREKAFIASRKHPDHIGHVRVGNEQFRSI